jgi:hypothetical protein
VSHDPAASKRVHAVPLESRDGKLVLLVPLDSGGKELIDCTRGIGNVEGDVLCISIPAWLAAKQGLEVGSFYVIWNDSGEFAMESLDP